MKYEPRLEGRLKEVYRRKIFRLNGERMVSVIMAQMRSGHCAKSEYYKKRIGVSGEAECVDCEEEEEKDHCLETPAKERSRRICGITEVGYLCNEPALVGYLTLAYPSWVRHLN